MMGYSQAAGGTDNTQQLNGPSKQESNNGSKFSLASSTSDLIPLISNTSVTLNLLPNLNELALNRNCTTPPPPAPITIQLPPPLIQSPQQTSNSGHKSNAEARILSTPTIRKHGPSPSWALGSPTRSIKRRMSSHDRFIPDRKCDSSTAYLLNSDTFGSASKAKSKNVEVDIQKESLNRIYSDVLKNEIFGSRSSLVVDRLQTGDDPDSSSVTSPHTPQPNNITSPRPRHKLLQFHPPQKTTIPHAASSSTASSMQKLKSARKLDFSGVLSAINNPQARMYSTSPLSIATQQALQFSRRPPRNIPKVPFKILDAPELADDFYLNVVDWGSSSNMLGVGLGNSVYLWSSGTGRVSRLHDFGPYDSVTSVNWATTIPQLAIGTNRGTVQLWDISQNRVVRTFNGHTGRVGSLAWNGNILTSGSRDRSILHRDTRAPTNFTHKLSAHKQEVCGLRWNTIDNQLASGGNDNKLFVWDKMAEEPVHRLVGHSAAVKALSWSPHQRGILASGGGTADRKIKFWNTQNGTLLQSIDTGSQVCNLSWSLNSNELVSTHGYSQNQIVVWKYPTMQQIATLTGHTYRVLYLAMSPDGQTVVTGAGDETLRFWNVFAKRKTSDSSESLLNDSPRSIR